jgi:hypothetical protein
VKKVILGEVKKSEKSEKKVKKVKKKSDFGQSEKK